MAVRRVIAAGLLAWGAAGIKVDSDRPEIRRLSRAERRQDKRVRLARKRQEKEDQKKYPAGSVLVATGYWRLTNTDSDQGGLRNGPGGYTQRMHMVMRLNTPMVIYGDDFGVSAMAEARGNATPALVDKQVVPKGSFEPCATYDNEMRANPLKYTHPLHMHSITLGCIWDGKMSLIKKAKQENPGYKWYTWLDIGMHGGPAMEGIFNKWGSKPWPNPDKLNSLPRDKVSVSRTSECARCLEGYHFCHCIAATAMIIPAEIVETAVGYFYEELEECMKHSLTQEVEPLESSTGQSGWSCLSEQHIMTQVEKAHPGFFHMVGRGYGTIAANLTMANEEFAKLDTSDIFDWLSTAPGAVTKVV